MASCSPGNESACVNAPGLNRRPRNAENTDTEACLNSASDYALRFRIATPSGGRVTWILKGRPCIACGRASM